MNPEEHLSNAADELKKAAEKIEEEKEKPREKRIESRGWLTDAQSTAFEAMTEMQKIESRLRDVREDV